MTERIAFITTGGTIGSVIRGNVLGTDKSSQSLNRKISDICDNNNVEVQVYQALNKISEDMAPDDWVIILEAVSKCIEEGVTRIVITHGTDTMAFAATAIGLYFQNTDVKICLTGSFYPLEHPETDVPLNLTAAINTVLDRSIANGVYVAFRNDSSNSYANIFHATDLKPMPFDGIGFEARYNNLVATFFPDEGVSVTSNAPKPISLALDSNNLPVIDLIRNAPKKVFQSIVYPGMDLSPIMSGSNNLDFIIFSLYHSGTGPSEQLPNSLIDFIESQDKIASMVATFPSRYIETPYESTIRILQSGARLYRDLQPHQIYVYLICGLASGLSSTDLLSGLKDYQCGF